MSVATERARRIEEHGKAEAALAGTGFSYLHINWRLCGCDDAEAIRSMADRDSDVEPEGSSNG